MIPELLGEDLAVVFCGTAAGDKSAKDGVYYAGFRNKFWSVLARTGLTPRQLRSEEYGLLLAHDIGLSDLRKRPGAAAALASEDLDVARFRTNMASHRPAIVAFNGKEAAQRCLGRESVSYGCQMDTFENAMVYVLPSTSEGASDHWDDAPWMALAAEVRRIRSGR